jgi:hypothetical protein
MSVYIITGKLGSGKTLIAVGMMQEALRAGKKVATNVDLWLENMLTWKDKRAVCYRLPDKLSAQSFETIGHGNEHFIKVRDRELFDEEKNGLIVLDEGGLSMNSRDYREAGRKEFIEWCIHSRKRGWDVAILVQHFDTLDKQIRDMFGEHVVYCMRFDKMAIPFVGWLLQLVGFSGKGAKVHMAVCRYGQSHDSPIAWRKAFKGADLYFAFNTRQQYYPRDDEGVYQYLTPWHIKGRSERPSSEYKAILEDIWHGYFNVAVSRVLVFFCAMGFGMYAHAKYFDQEVRSGEVEKKPASISGLEFGAPDPVQGTQTEGDQVQTVDPWETAYLSTHVVLSEGRSSYRIRNLQGDKLTVPEGGVLRSIGPCNAVVRIHNQEYYLTCKRPG